MSNFDFWATMGFIVLLFLVTYPMYRARRQNSDLGAKKWGEEEAWRIIEYGGKNYPIRSKELPIWSIMSRDERRLYVNTLEKYLKNGTLRLEEVDGVKMILATEKGRKIKFDALEFYNVNKKDGHDKTRSNSSH